MPLLVPTPRRLRQEASSAFGISLGYEFKAILGYLGKLCLKTKETTTAKQIAAAVTTKQVEKQLSPHVLACSVVAAQLTKASPSETTAPLIT